MKFMPCTSLLLVFLALSACGDSSPGSERSPEEEARYHLDLGDVHFRHKQWDLAHAEYGKASSLTSNSELLSRAQLGFAILEMEKKDTEAAVNHLRLSADHSNGKRKGQLLLKRAAVLQDAGRKEEAEVEIDAVLKNPELAAVHVDAYKELLRLYKGRYPDLVKKVQGELKANPSDRMKMGFLGDLFAEILDEPGKAIQVYQKQHKSEPRNVALVSRIFQLALKVGHAQIASEYGELLATLSEREPRARLAVHLQMGDLYRQAKKYDEAIRHMNQAEPLATMSEKVDIRAAIYRIRKENNTLDQEIKKLESDASWAELWMIYRRVLEDSEKALKTAERLLKKSPDQPIPMQAVMTSAALAKKYDRVAEMGTQMLEKHPGSSATVIGLYANAMVQLKKSEEAVKVLTAAADKEPGISPICYLSLAALDAKKAQEWQKKAVTVVVEQKDAQGCLLISQGLVQSRAYQNALTTCEAGLGFQPSRTTHAQLQWLQIQILERMGRLPDAEMVCRALATNMDAVLDVRRQAEKKLLELLQKQGKKVSIQPK